ncbi:class I adenylate-forming enzyme family protein [Nocardia sp. NPDC059239]|uniref:class I adenylate-forming enzyme family protein n=1 Tax=unclassified Nocardia TaxID=2637762 RepID=UPI0036B1CE85
MWLVMWLSQLLDRNCQCRGNRTAVIDGEIELNWNQFERRVRNLAGGLLHCGVGRGDRVGVLSRDRHEVLVSYFALARIGAVFAPINHGLVKSEAAQIIRDAGLSMLLGEPELVHRHNGELPLVIGFGEPDFRVMIETDYTGPLPDIRIDDIAAILHTSATTGKPKGVVVDHRSFKDISLGWLAVAHPGDDAVLVNCCPLFHGSVVVCLAFMAAGATVVLLPGFKPQTALAAAEQHGATHLWLVPQMLRYLIDTPAAETTKLDGLREILYGAAPMPPELYAAAARRIRCGYRQVYGMTEVGGPFVTLAPAEHPQPEMAQENGIPAGRAIPGMSVRIADDSGADVPLGTVGEVLVRGEGLMRGYWHNPQATAAVIDKGWARTGDLGWIDNDGFIHLVDRIKDVIIRGGQNVYPAEIERALRTHPAVGDVGVVGVPDHDWGEVPLAFVVPAAEAEVAEQDLLRHLVTTLASYKRPQRVVFTDRIPRNPAGKILKNDLRARVRTLDERAEIAAV